MKNHFHFLLLYLGIFSCLFFAFSYTAIVPYVQHDNVRYFHKFFNEDENVSIDPFRATLYAEGRPLSAEIEEFIYKKINHLSDLAFLRLLGIVVIALSASLLVQMVLSFSIKEIIPVVSLSIAVFTLPGIQDFIFLPFMFNVIAVLLSVLAYVTWKGEINYWIRFMFTLILLEEAFFMYPSTALVFLIPTAFIVVFGDNWQISRKVWMSDMLIWIFAGLIHYFTLKVFLSKQLKLSGHEILFTAKQTWLNIVTFLPQGVPHSFNLWNIFYSQELGIFLAFLVAIPVCIDFFVTKEMGWGRLGALMALFLVSNMVWFLFGGFMPRQFVASQAIVLLLIYWSGNWLLRRWNISRRVILFWPMMIMMTGLLVTFVTIKYNALNYNAELMFIRGQLIQLASNSTRQIHVIGQKYQDVRGYNGLATVYDNLNATSTNTREISDLVRAALKDSPVPSMHCVVTFSRYGQPYKLFKDSIVIHMNDLIDGDWKKYINMNFPSSKNYYSVPTLIYPNDFDYSMRGYYYEQQNNDQFAMLFYTKGLEINPYNADVYDARGELYYDQGDYKSALADFDMAISLNPNFLGVYNERAIIYGEQGRYSLAMQDLDRLINIDPQAKNYINRGIIYGYQGQLQHAITDFNKAIMLEPNNAKAYSNLAICYFDLKDYVHSWANVHKAQSLGLNVSQPLLEALNSISKK